MYNRYASFWKKSPFVTKRWMPLTFPQRSVKKKKIRENFRFPLWKAARKVGKFQSSWDEDSRERWTWNENLVSIREPPTLSREKRDRYLVATPLDVRASDFSRETRHLDVIKDSIYALSPFPCAMIYGSLPVPSILRPFAFYFVPRDLSPAIVACASCKLRTVDI